MLFDDEDDDYGNDIGEWRNALLSPSSLGSDESPNRDMSSEEQPMGANNVSQDDFALVAPGFG